MLNSNEGVDTQQNQGDDFYLSFAFQNYNNSTGFGGGYIFGYKLGKLTQDRIQTFCREMEKSGGHSKVSVIAISKL